MKEDYDGAEPTASSVSVMNLLTLSHLVDDPQWTDRIERTLRLFGDAARADGARRADDGGGAVDASRPACSRSSSRRAKADDGAGSRGRSRCSICRSRFSCASRPRRAARLAGSLPFIAAMQPVDGAAAAYVCRDFTCRQPVTTVDALEQELGITA